MRQVCCTVLGKEAPGLDAPPFPGALGLRIYNEVSREGWEAWIRHQTMIINEYRLSAADPKAREFLKAEMIKFLFGSGSKPPPGYEPPGAVPDPGKSL
jgi:Fe-S cluster biosynthesis and repair protein YggX